MRMTSFFAPFFTTAFSSTGSRIGSTSFSTFSMSRQRPSPIVNSIWSLSSLLDSVVTHIIRFWEIRAFSRCRIQRFAWPCGSTISGYRDERVTMMPFWTESSSLGSPSKAHSPTVAESIRKLTRSALSLAGTFLACVSFQYSAYSMSRYSELKGPQYTTKAQMQATSPTRRLRRRAKFLESSVHRAFSPERPFRSLFAASIWRCIAAALSWRAFIAAWALPSSTFSSSTSSSTFFSSASAASS
mmetsp:Transcript_72373/g.156510  ORF Transcript_72373/g.156510 Transcript_72373/m.156510 type:complete len:243 (-) Transcript_72373:2505-3233(-)